MKRTLFLGRSLGKYLLQKAGRRPALGNCSVTTECRNVYLSGTTPSFVHPLTVGSRQPALLRVVPPWFGGKGYPTGGGKKATTEGIEAVIWAQHTLGAEPRAGGSLGALKRLQGWWLFLFLAVNRPLVAAAEINLLSLRVRAVPPFCVWAWFHSLKALPLSLFQEKNKTTSATLSLLQVWFGQTFLFKC